MPEVSLHTRPGAIDLNRVEIKREETDDLERQVSNANRAAVQHALHRLESRLPSAALTDLHAYFSAAAFHPWPSEHARPRVGALELLKELCSNVQSIAVGRKAQGLQIGFLRPGAEIDPATLGTQVEPASDLYLLSPYAIWEAAAANASVEVRVFDRKLTEWAWPADDLAAVSGADIFMKLFVAGGEQSVNGWHRDFSDVLVTVLDGSKRFQVGTVDSPDEHPVIETDVVLEPGDALLLPRFRLHNAIPTGEVSALLSIGIMRYGDWSFRGASPSHLGLGSPRSPLSYRRALHPHVSPYWGAFAAHDCCRTRIPGGIGILEHHDETVKLMAAGQVLEAPAEVVRLLAKVHGADGITVSQLAAESGQPASWCGTLLTEFANLGLIWYSRREIPPDSYGSSATTHAV